MNPAMFGQPPAAMPMGAAPQPAAPALTPQMLGQAIAQTLTPAEFAELDQYITPRFVELVSKFAPELGPMLAPFIQNDEAMMDAEAQMGQMGNAMPQGMGGAPAGFQEEEEPEEQRADPFQNVWAQR